MGHISLSLSEYVLRLRILEAGRLPVHIGTTLRGGFGRALREISCVYPGVSCKDCILGSRCAYAYLFETPVSPDATIMRRYKHSPHPFVLAPPTDHPQQVYPDLRIDVGLVVFGHAFEFFPHLVFAMKRLGELGLGKDRLPFALDTIHHQPSGRLVYKAGRADPVVPPEPVRVTAEVGHPSSRLFCINYVSPLRLRVRDRVIRTPSFAPLMSAALRRLNLLCHVHDTGDFTVDAPGIVKAAEAVRLIKNGTCWDDQERFSQRQDRRMPLGGIVGSATYEGDIGTFRDILKLAGRVHVGKGTACGHGRFSVAEGPSNGTGN